MMNSSTFQENNEIIEMMQEEKRDLLEKIDNLEIEVRVLKINNTNLEKTQDEKFRKMSLKLNNIITDLQKKCEDLEEFNAQESKVFKALIRKLAEENQEFKIKNQSLETMLRIPRTHMQFLKENGKLEEFVEAKVLGQDARAKWLLMSNAEIELEKIEQRIRLRDKIMSSSVSRSNSGGNVSPNESMEKTKATRRSMITETDKKFIVCSSINDQRTSLKKGKWPFDISFIEVPSTMGDDNSVVHAKFNN